MGKAGKWLLNFLVGKRDEKPSQKKKKKKMNSCLSAENLMVLRTESDSQNINFRWSFRKRSGNLVTHKGSKSVDSIDTSKALKLAMAEAESEKKKKKKKKLIDGQRAATKIQSAYRSHLARKALHALRGLVKLQAVVRGHLVRRQTAATLKSMHALMAIQVRARANRIRTIEHELSVHRHFLNDNHKIPFKRLNANPDDLRRTYRSKSGYISHSHIERIENEQNMCSSRRDLAISKRQHQYENYSQCYLSMSKNNAEKPSYSSNYSFNPNYMSKTESSRAKLRSQSEPKQRPGSTYGRRASK